MPQVAQQDYIKVNITDVSSLTEQEKATIRKHVENGTIFDIIFVYDVELLRVSAVDTEQGFVTVYIPSESAQFQLSYIEE